jgi:hypothetical protein
MSADGRKVVLLGHSKGAVDSAAALSLFPELCSVVAGLVSLQGPHAGSAIAHDLSNTQLQKTVVRCDRHMTPRVDQAVGAVGGCPSVQRNRHLRACGRVAQVLGALEKLLRGCKHGALPVSMSMCPTSRAWALQRPSNVVC